MLFDITKYIQKNISGILQVGAHHGAEYNILKNICPNILMFEPQKRVFEILKQNVGNEEQVILENLAVGSTVGTMTMNVEYENGGQSSSLLKPAMHMIQYPGIKFTDTEEVNVITLNEYFKDKKYSYNLMTLDVQGYELEVLKGASDILHKVDYILCEVNRSELYHGCPMVEEIDYLLSQFNLKREITSWDGGSWGDALYIKNEL